MTKTFTTSDLYLASALKLSGFKLVSLTKLPSGRGLFHFQDRADRVRLVTEYFAGELTGSLKGFSNCWADLKSLINEIEIETERTSNARSTR